MLKEQGPSSENQNPLESLRGKNYVVAETFFILNGSSDKEAREKVRTSLFSQGVTDPVAVTFCDSEEERISAIINSLKTQKALIASNDPSWMGIVGFDAIQLQKILETFSAMISKEDPILEDIDPRNITILQLNAQYHTNPARNVKTGLTLAALRKEEQLVFPIAH